MVKQSDIEQLVGEKYIAIPKRVEFSVPAYGIRDRRLRHPFTVIETGMEDAAHQLRDGASELALIPTIEYALKKEVWRIVPDICVAARGGMRSIRLFFNRGLKDIHKIAVPPQSGNEATLLQIIMREKYQISADYHQTPAELNEMLENADAALVVGDQAIVEGRSARNHLDLTEEWTDLTDLPFVLGFWSGRELTVNRQDLDWILRSFQLGIRNVEKISRSLAGDDSEDWSVYHDFLSAELTYRFSEAEKNALTEFYTYAFFYGLSEHIPDLHFFDDAQQELSDE